MKFLSTLLLLFILHQQSLVAQILNSDNFGSYTDTSNRVAGRLNIGFNITRNIETVYNFSSQTDLRYRISRHALVFAGSFELLQRKEERFINGGFFHSRFRYKYERRLVPEVFVQYQWDGVRGLKDRRLAGSNLRYRLHSDSTGFIYIAGGLMYEYERWDHSAVDEELGLPDDLVVESNLIKFTSYISFNKKFSPATNARFILYYQAVPDLLFLQPRLAADLSINFNISSWMIFNFASNLTYDSNPVVPIDKLYFTVRNGISINF